MSMSWYPRAPLPELRNLVEVARAYLAGKVHYSHVCCAVPPFCDAARLFSAEPALKKMAEEWSTMAIRVWPEMAQIDNPITEAEFKQWVQTELQVFEPFDASHEQPTV